MVFTQPGKFFLAAGFGEGPTRLNAFDQALLNSGIGNVNLIRISSILPPAAQRISPVKLPFGVLVPAAYSDESSDIKGQVVSAAVACGVPIDSSQPGVIMEYHLLGSKDACLDRVLRMVEAAFKVRNLPLGDIYSASASGTVTSVGVAVAAVVLWG